MKQVLLVLTVACLAAGISFAGSGWKDGGDWGSSPLGRSYFGEQWSGPAVPRDQLEGKVVWVTILKSSSSDTKILKDMASLDRAYRRRGVVMIAMNYFKTDKDKCLSYVKRANARFPVFESGQISWEGKGREGVTNTRNAYRLPYAVLYGPNGEIEFEGPCPPSSSKMARHIKSALRKMPSSSGSNADDDEENDDDLDAVLEGLDTSKISDLESLVKRKKLGIAISKCQTAKDTEGGRGVQANELLSRLNVYASRKLSQAKQQRKILPSKAIEKLRECQKEFSGSNYSKEADAMIDKYKQDKEFQADLAAEKQYQSVVKYAERIPVPEKSESYDSWQKKNGRRLQLLEKKIDAFKKKNPDSMFCKRLDRMRKDYDDPALKPKDDKKGDADDDDDADDDNDKGKDKDKDKDKKSTDDESEDKTDDNDE